MPPSRREKKKPPTFNHFPAARAKVLKQAWVEKTKIKSKWKAERRKLGLAPAQIGGDPVQNRNEKGVDEEEGSQKEQEPSDIERDEETRAPENSQTAFELRNDKPSVPQNDRGSQSKSQPPQSSRDSSVNLRELARKAYSRESLHTYKSDPLKRRAQGEHAKKGKGRGQPNMKLRMNVMLEKIKRDYP